MSYYFIAQIKIKDNSIYKKYINEAEKVFSKFNGKYLAVDDNTKILEGNWNYTRSVLIEFKTEKDFYKWYNSKEYQNILKYRLEAADCDSVLIKGTLKSDKT